MAESLDYATTGTPPIAPPAFLDHRTPMFITARLIRTSAGARIAAVRPHRIQLVAAGCLFAAFFGGIAWAVSHFATSSEERTLGVRFVVLLGIATTAGVLAVAERARRIANRWPDWLHFDRTRSSIDLPGRTIALCDLANVEMLGYAIPGERVDHEIRLRLRDDEVIAVVRYASGRMAKRLAAELALPIVEVRKTATGPPDVWVTPAGGKRVRVAYYKA